MSAQTLCIFLAFYISLFSVYNIKIFFHSHLSPIVLCFNPSFHYHLFFCTRYYFLDVLLFYCFFSHRVCASVCDCERGVSLSGSSGDEPTAGFYSGRRCLFFGVKNNNQMRGSAPHACCALIASEFLHRLSHGEPRQKTHAAQGRVMSDEALRASKKAAAVCVGECLMKTGSRGVIAQ